MLPLGMVNKKIKDVLATLPRIDDYASRSEWEAAAWPKIVASRELLQLLITLHERRDLVLRAAAAKALVSGKSYREIGDALWLSPQTISGIKKAIREQTYQSYLERSKTERKKKIYRSIRERRPRRPLGIRRRTKYGTIYM